MTTSTNMSDKDLEDEVREYQWTAGYDRNNEYDQSPDWSKDIVYKEEEVSDNEPFTRPYVKFYNKLKPKTEWIRSNTVYNLIKMR